MKPLTRTLVSPYVVIPTVITVATFAVVAYAENLSLAFVAAFAVALGFWIMGGWRYPKSVEPAETPTPSVYEDGFVPRNQLKPKDAVRANLHTFEKTNYRVMCFSNNEGDAVETGELIGFQITGSSAFPVVRRDDGSEHFHMGFVLPYWKELAEFLAEQESRSRFWNMVSLMHGWSGLERFDQIVSDAHNKR